MSALTAEELHELTRGLLVQGTSDLDWESTATSELLYEALCLMSREQLEDFRQVVLRMCDASESEDGYLLDAVDDEQYQNFRASLRNAHPCA